MTWVLAVVYAISVPLTYLLRTGPTRAAGVTDAGPPEAAETVQTADTADPGDTVKAGDAAVAGSAVAPSNEDGHRA